MVDIARARLERSVETNMGVVDSGAAQVYGTLSQRLHEFSNRQMKDYAQQRIAQGSKEGAQASAGKVSSKLPEGNTMYEQAYIESALKGHAAAIKNSIDEKNVELQLKYPLDSQGYADEWKGFSNGLVKGVDPMLQPMATAELADSYTRGHTKILSNEREQQLAENAAQQNTAAQSLLMQGEKFQFDGNYEKAEEYRQRALALFDDPLTHTPAQIAEFDNSSKKSLDTYAILGSFDKARNKQAFLDNFRKKKAGTKDLTLADIERLDDKMQADINALRARAEAGSRKLTSDANDILTQTARGDDVKDRFQTTYSRLYGINPEAALEFKNKFDNLEYVASFNGKPVSLLGEAISRYDNENPTINESDRQQMLLKKLPDLLESQSPENVVATAMKYNPEFDLTSFQDFSAESFAERDEKVKAVEAYFNVHGSNRLTPGEMSALTSTWENTPKINQVALATNMVEGLGENSVPLLETLADNGHTTMFNVARLIKEGDPDAAQHVLEGANVPPERVSKNAKSGMSSYAAITLYTMFPEDPEHTSVLSSAATAIYNHLAVTSNVDKDDEFDPKLGEKALKMAMGGFDDVFGHPVPMPTRSTSGRDVERWLEASPLPEVPGYSEDIIRERIMDGIIIPEEWGKGEYILKWKRMSSYGPAPGNVIGADGKSIKLKYTFVPPTPTEFMEQQQLLDPIPGWSPTIQFGSP